jgi:hypothetical protein
VLDLSLEWRYQRILRRLAPAGSIPSLSYTSHFAKRRIDFARRAGGVERIVEIGDGQVSDLVGWAVERFVKIWDDVG